MTGRSQKHPRTSERSWGNVVTKKWLLILALTLAYASQAIFFPDNPNGAFFQKLLAFAPWLGEERMRLVVGVMGYALAMGLFAWVAPAMNGISNQYSVLASLRKGCLPQRTQRTQSQKVGFMGVFSSKPDDFLSVLSALCGKIVFSGGPVSSVQRGRRGAWGTMGVATALLGSSMARFLLTGEDGITRGLWVASMVALVMASVWMAGEGRKLSVFSDQSSVFRWRHVAVLAAILGGAAWLRFHLLADIPQDLHGDMASMGLQARDILAGAAPGIFHQGWAEIPMLGFYPSVIGLKFVSNSILGLNFMPAVEGLLTILGLYLLAWRLFDSHRLAALAAAALVVNIPHIHFSRLAAYMDPWPWILFAFLLLAHGLRSRRLWPFPLAGLLVGVSLQMYYSGRAVLFILPAAALYLILLHPKTARRGWRFGLAAAALLGLGTVTALGPSLIYFLQHTNALLERSRSVFLFHEPVMTHLMGKYGVDTPAAVVWEQIWRSALMFNDTHDTSTQFGYTHPMFTLALSPLVLLGLGYSLRRWRHPGLGFALIWLLTILITGSVLTNNAPFWPRLVGILPAAALMAGVALHVTLSGLGLDRPIRSVWDPNPAVVVMMGLIIAFLVLGQRNWRDYFLTTSNNARPRARIGRYLDALPDAINACGFSTPYRLSEREIAFLAWPHQLLDLEPGVTGPLLEACPGPERVWILSPDEPSQRIRVERRWPDGQLREIRDGAGRVVFLSYLTGLERLPASAEDASPRATSSAYLPNGDLFRPDHVYLGDVNSRVARWRVGPVEVRGGRVTLTIGPISGHDAPFDYVEFLGADGQRHRFEAEDLTYEGDIRFVGGPGQDNRWWLQRYDPFSGGAGLVAQKNELVPALRAAIPLPDGLYDLTIGTFTGDPANGVFALGVSVQ